MCNIDAKVSKDDGSGMFYNFSIEVIVIRIIQDVLELTLYCYHDVFRSGYSSPPENRLV